MDELKNTHYLKTLADILNVSIVYGCFGGAIRYFQPFSLRASENDFDFIIQRLQPAFGKFPDKNVMYCVTSSLIMMGIVVNHITDEFVFVGPMASGASTPRDIQHYLAQADLSPEAADKLGAYMEKHRPLSQDEFLALLSNINTVINDQILPPTDIVALYDDQTAKRVAFAQQEYFWEASRQDSLDPNLEDLYTARLNFCLENGDLEGLSDLLNDMPSGLDNSAQSLEEFRIVALGSIFAAETTALKSGIPSKDLEKTKHYYLRRISASASRDEMNQLILSALFDFTRVVKEFLPFKTENPTINRAINYIKTNINTRIRVDDIAHSLGINAHYLHSKFKAETGKTIVQYINEEKIKKACFYLQFTDKSLSEIASFLSFSSQSHFQAVFKKQMNQTPTLWRLTNAYAK